MIIPVDNIGIVDNKCRYWPLPRNSSTRGSFHKDGMILKFLQTRELSQTRGQLIKSSIRGYLCLWETGGQGISWFLDPGKISSFTAL